MVAIYFLAFIFLMISVACVLTGLLEDDDGKIKTGKKFFVCFLIIYVIGVVTKYKIITLNLNNTQCMCETQGEMNDSNEKSVD